MTVYSSPDAYRLSTLGNGPVSKASGALSAATFPLFTVVGEVLITGLWLKVTTSITTDAGTLAVNNVPTAGNTNVLVTATDLGTTDSTVGTVIGVGALQAAAGPAFVRGGNVALNQVATAGVVNLVGAAAVNGAVTVYATWVPLTDGSTLVAA